MLKFISQIRNSTKYQSVNPEMSFHEVKIQSKNVESTSRGQNYIFQSESIM